MSPSGPTRYGATRADLEALIGAMGEPRYRVDQVRAGLWDQRRPLAEVTSLPRALRDELARRLPLALDPVLEQRSGDGRTRKWLWSASDGAQLETVLMEGRSRATVCVSSQAGCAMGCTFCATGQAGFERHLSTGEILEQVVRAAHASTARVSNVVFMGMGEPLANVGPVLGALDRLHADLGLSARHLTVSTVGVVPGMRRLTDHPLPVTLAVSLHAPTDEARGSLVPLNRAHPLSAVVAAAADHAARRGRRVTFEYAVVHGVNDRHEDVAALVSLLRGFPGGGAHVNLIPLNPTPGFGSAPPPDRRRLGRFADAIRAGGLAATVRRTRGADIEAACGQLRVRPAATVVRAGPAAAHGAQ